MSGFINSRRHGFHIDERKVIQGLGWFSIGLGLAELLLPRTVSRTVGVRGNPGLMRFLGLREISSGIGILTQKRPTQWMWSRVGGDAMDLALLGAAFLRSSSRGRVCAATAAVAGVAALDLAASKHLLARNGRRSAGDGYTNAIHVTKTITINQPASELYQFWRNFENLPRIMANLESVTVTDDRSRWVAKGPGKKVCWDAVIINETPNELIAWRTVDGSQIELAGTVRFSPASGNRGTIVKVEMQYWPPGGILGAAFARVTGREPSVQIEDALRVFKQLMETGVIATTKGQPAGRRHSLSWKFDHDVPEMSYGMSPAPANQ